MASRPGDRAMAPSGDSVAAGIAAQSPSPSPVARTTATAASSRLRRCRSRASGIRASSSSGEGGRRGGEAIAIALLSLAPPSSVKGVHGQVFRPAPSGMVLAQS